MEELQELQTIFEQYFFDSEWDNEEWSEKSDEIRIKHSPAVSESRVSIAKSEHSEKSSDAKTIITDSTPEESSDASSKPETELSLNIPCLKNISISDSELKFLNIYSFYPVPEDPGLKKAFWKLYPTPQVYKENGIDKFFDLAKLLKLAPIECLRHHLQSKEVNLKYYCIDAEIMQALSEAMLSNATVRYLNLQESDLNEDACYYLNRILLKNTTLKKLDLTACRIGVEGARRLQHGLATSAALAELYLNRCELGNEGFQYIANAVIKNTLLRKLDVSNNNLDEGSANYLQKMITKTDSLEFLNLSWNSLYTHETAEKLFKSLQQNTTINHLDLSWNSIGKDSAPFLYGFFAHCKRIEYLNFAANRITDHQASAIASNLLFNRCLKQLRLAQNPLGSRGITTFIKILTSQQFAKCPLELLDLEGFWATKAVVPMLEKLKELKPELIIKLGGILENYTIVGPNIKELYFKTANYEAMNTKKKKERRDFGHFVLSLEGSKISKGQFKEKLKDAKIKINDNLATEIIDQFLITKKHIDGEALKESYLSFFPDTKLPMPKKPKVAEEEEEPANKKGKKKGSKKKGSSKAKKGSAKASPKKDKKKKNV